MDRLILSVLFGFTTAVFTFGAEEPVLARITVYWRAEGQLRASWNGARLRDGHCAVDPKKIPYGSKVVFPDITCVAVDTGPAVVSRKAARSCGRSASERNAVVIDRFFETKQEAVRWTKTHPHFMVVQIHSPGTRATQNNATIAANNSDSGMSVANRPNPQTFAWCNVFHATLERDRSIFASALLRCARRRT
jgi:hypothetical protein